MAEVASAYVALVPSFRGGSDQISRELGPDLDKAGRKSGSRFGNVFARSWAGPLKAVGIAAVGLFAATKVSDFFKSSIAEAREAQKVSALTGQVIKTTGGAANVSAAQVGKLATAISKKVGIDDEAIQSGANLLLTFKNIRDEAGAGNDIFNQATKTTVDLAAGLAAASGGEVDLRSASIQVGKALNDPIRGVTALTRVGVTFTDKQKKQITTLVKHGKTLDAQKIILKELTSEFGGAAASQVTNGKKMSVAFGNLKETIGTALIPVLDGVENVLTTAVIPALSATVGFLTRNADTIKTVLIVLAPFIAALTAYKVVQLAAAAATKVQVVAQAALNAVMEANPLTLVIVALAALAVGLTIAYKKSETFRKIVHAAFHAVADAVDFVKDHWKAFATAFAFLIGGPIAGAIVLLVTHFGDVKSAALAVKNFVVDKFNAIVDFFRGLPGRITHAASGMFDGIKDAFRSAINWIIDGWNRLEFKLPKVNTHIPGVGTIGGWTLGTPDIPRLARGGRLITGGSVLVGEDGPELLTLPRGALVSPNIAGMTQRDPVIVNNYYPAPERASDAVPRALREAAFVHGVAW